LGAAGVEIPFPQRDLHLRSIEDGAARQLSQHDKNPQIEQTERVSVERTGLA
jgi:small-conductance mechanosensitive channel